MESNNSRSYVTLAEDSDELDVRRAQVFINPTPNDRALWDAMDMMSDRLTLALTNRRPFELLTENGPIRLTSVDKLSEVLPYPLRRIGVGTTHHEAGTLKMGNNPRTSVTDANGRFHYVPNVFAVGPSLFPSSGDANPVLTGIALTWRLARHLVGLSQA